MRGAGPAAGCSCPKSRRSVETETCSCATASPSIILFRLRSGYCMSPTAPDYPQVHCGAEDEIGAACCGKLAAPVEAEEVRVCLQMRAALGWWWSITTAFALQLVQHGRAAAKVHENYAAARLLSEDTSAASTLRTVFILKGLPVRT